MIRRFVIRNFKRFRDETAVDLDPVTVLVGANNSGKSTVLEALNLFQYCIETTRRAQRANGGKGDNGLLASKTVSPEEFGALPVADPGDLWPQGRVKGAITLRAEYDAGVAVGFDLSMSYNRFSIRPKLSGDPSAIVSNGAIRMVPIFSGFLPQEEFLTPPARTVRMRMQRHGEIVRNLLWDLHERSTARWKQLEGIMLQLFPDAHVDVNFDLDVDAFIRATYHDAVLTRDRDVISAGSGFHQALQIFATVLSPETQLLLLDEPDAHLHARLQGQLMDVFDHLARAEGLQFVVATHSPHLLNAAPSGALRVCVAGKVVPFGTDPEQLRVLETVGAMDRMEVVPLLSNRIVVFVESKGDRKLLESFAIRLWGEKRTREIWARVSFLYTYQEPVSAGVLDLARQVRDLLVSPGLPVLQQPVRFLAIGDRDYRTDEVLRGDIQHVTRKAKSEAYKLDLRLHLWALNEIENYLLDRKAIVRALDKQAADGGEHRWKVKKPEFTGEIDRLLTSARETARQRIASRIQQQDRRLDLTTALNRADAFLNQHWGDGSGWCDAKRVLSALRAWLQAQNLKLRLSELDIIEHISDVPPDIDKALALVRGLTRKSKATRLASARKQGRVDR